MAPPRRFCVLTTGRTGSTSLMDGLAAWDDVLVPHKLFTCVDNELLHPDHGETYKQRLEALSGRRIRSRGELLERFFAQGSAYRYAGFKSMPNRHPRYRAFIEREDLQFIVLVRADVAATVASFLVALRTGSWRRAGGAQAAWTFRREDRSAVLDNLLYVHASHAQLAQVPGAIRLTYEELCSPAFHSAELERFFGRPVQLRAPRPPLTTADYVTNWPEFEAFIHAARRQLEA
ncbi:MAG: hypothetical protein JXB05_32110 [Myxococcaceae bacterium]|nr:hypothetical protein [Myxococcaceae bacterium]